MQRVGTMSKNRILRGLHTFLTGIKDFSQVKRIKRGPMLRRHRKSLSILKLRKKKTGIWLYEEGFGRTQIFHAFKVLVFVRSFIIRDPITAQNETKLNEA